MAQEIWKQPKRKKRRAETEIVPEGHYPPQEMPLEIFSGALIPRFYPVYGTFVYQIQANTAQGLRTFENAEELLIQQPIEARHPRRSHVTLKKSSWTLSVSLSTAVFPVTQPETRVEEELSPPDSLAILADPKVPFGKRRQMILAAEEMPFTPSQADELKPLLRRYIDRLYGSEQAEDQVAVASAVRKYVALLSPAELPALAELLQAERKASPAFEMEVAKMVTRKLTAILPEDTAPLGPLAEQLIDLVRSYMNPRFLPKRHCGAIAFDATLALPLLASPHVAELLDRLRKLSVTWFRASIARHARALSADLSRRFPEDRSARACSALTELAAAADTHPS